MFKGHQHNAAREGGQCHFLQRVWMVQADVSLWESRRHWEGRFLIIYGDHGLEWSDSRTGGLSKFGQSTHTVTVAIDVAYSRGHLNTRSPSGVTVCKIMGLWEAEACWRKCITGGAFEYS